jgi:hypothetical protein
MSKRFLINGNGIQNIQMSSLTETLQSNLNNPASPVEFDLYAALDEVLNGVGLTASDCGGKITFYGKDPIVPSRLRFGTMSAIGLAAKAAAAAAIWKFRSGEGQDILGITAGFLIADLVSDNPK